MITHVLHTGVRVYDLESSIELYKALGFELVLDFQKPDPAGRAVHVKKADMTFELWHFDDDNHPQIPYIANHIALYSDDLEADVADFVTKGYELVIPITEGTILRYAFVQDPSGTFCYEIATEKTNS